MIILIIGESGSGKTSSIKNCKNAVVLKCLPKRTPFKNVESQIYVEIDSLEKLIKALRRALESDKSVFVIDDFQFLMLKKVLIDSKKDKFAAYLNVAESVIEILTMCENSDKRFYFLMHEETDDSGFKSPKTAGKMLKDKFVLEGFFTIVFRCFSINNEHFFQTKSNGFSVVKTPLGMFDDEKIENDISVADQSICKFYDIIDVKNVDSDKNDSLKKIDKKNELDFDD